MNNNIHLMPDEPTRFTPIFMDRMLEHTERLSASDITIQTGEPIYAEVYGKLLQNHQSSFIQHRTR